MQLKMNTSTVNWILFSEKYREFNRRHVLSNDRQAAGNTLMQIDITGQGRQYNVPKYE